jgi:hypothetical protein
MTQHIRTEEGRTKQQHRRRKIDYICTSKPTSEEPR